MPQEQERKVIVIVGPSRGLGLGLVKACLSKGWEVIATVRDARGRSALETLDHQGRLAVATVDITSAEDIWRLRAELAGRALDTIFVNAGIASDPAASIETAPERDFIEVMATNALAPLRIIGALHSLVKPDGVIAAMSSNMGSVSGNQRSGWEIYRASKAALNQLMKSFAARNADGRTYLAVSPGWVRTDMGGDAAPIDVDTSASGIVETLMARSGTGGVHFVDFRNETIEW
jgi:NAD(P)-dependent dehydrogenase (short-subunit alcohol dehydrogenase family)